MRAYRERKAAGEPSVRYRKPKDRRTRQRRWRDAAQELFDIQADCQVWLDNLPEGLKDSTIAEHLREVCEVDLSPLDAVLPPKGFGRD
jgi:hypothetical protein